MISALDLMLARQGSKRVDDAEVHYRVWKMRTRSCDHISLGVLIDGNKQVEYSVHEWKSDKLIKVDWAEWAELSRKKEEGNKEHDVDNNDENDDDDDDE